MNKVLILGLGNEFLSDVGIGVKIVNDIRNLFPVEKADFLTLITGSLDMIEELSGYELVIIIDAIKTKDGIPGKVSCFSLKEYQPTIHLDNFHDVRFPDSIKLAAELGLKVPKRILIIAIEIVEYSEFKNELSAQLNTTYNIILQNIVSLIRQHLRIQKTD
jgi:hydrogenase maturation protease